MANGAALISSSWRQARAIKLLPETRALQRDELEMTQGYFIPQTADSIIVKFLPHFEGYIWSFPRCDHLSVGICGSMAAHTSAELKTHLSAFVEKHGIPTRGRKVLQPRSAISERKHAFRSHGLGQELGVGRRCRGLGRSSHGRRAFLRDALRRIAGPFARGRLPGKIHGVGQGGVLFRTGICRAHRAPLLPRFVPRNGRHHAHGSIHEPQRGVPPIDERSLQRNAGLHQPQTPPLGPPGHHVSEFISSVLNLERPAAAQVPRGGAAAD